LYIHSTFYGFIQPFASIQVLHLFNLYLYSGFYAHSSFASIQSFIPIQVFTSIQAFYAYQGYGVYAAPLAFIRNYKTGHLTLAYPPVYSSDPISRPGPFLLI